MVVGPRDHHLAGLHRLAQGIEHLGRELGQFVEEQHAAMGQRDLAGPRGETAVTSAKYSDSTIAKTTP